MISPLAAHAQTHSMEPSAPAPQLLGDPPVATQEQMEESLRSDVVAFSRAYSRANDSMKSATDVAPVSGFTIDTTNRNSTIAGYHNYYMASEGYEGLDGFNGDVVNCVPGTLSADFQNKTLRRINYYRAQVGLPSDIYFDAAKSEKCQKAAIVMAYEDRISHFPETNFPDRPCIDQDVIDAAAAANLSLGSYGPGSIDGLITDDGSNNAVVGHRRWLLYPRSKEMGNGATPANGSYPYDITAGEYPYINVVWVIGDFKAPSAAQAVTWPNEGYVPWQLVPNEGVTYPRWSYSYPNADFSGASVSMTQGSTVISVTQEALATRYGDNTIVWRPSGIPNVAPVSDTTYTITITDIAGAPFTSVTYDVTVVDPYSLNDPPVITGPVEPVSGVETIYNFSAVDQAEAYEASIIEASADSWIEGAEDSPAPSIIDNTDAGYDLISSTYVATGSKSFHLSTPDFEDQSFEIDRIVIPQQGSQINFKYRRFGMHPDTKLHVELSLDDGASYDVLYTVDGQNTSGSSNDWDSDFIAAVVPLPEAYVNTLARLRFRLESTGTIYTDDSDEHLGLYLDDISVSNSLEATNSTVVPLEANANSFGITPVAANQQYYLQVRAQLGGHWFRYGDSLITTSTSAASSPFPIITSSSTATGEQGTIFTYDITASNSPISYGASGLPPGSSLNSNTGQITGAIAPGNYNDITISATNAAGTGNAPLTIHILTGYETAVNSDYPGLGGPDEDDDADGVVNILELAILGMDPTTPDVSRMPSATLSENDFVLTVHKSGIHGIDYSIEGTADLTPLSWSTNDLTVLTDDESMLEVSYPKNLSDKYFLRLNVTQNDDTTLEP